VLKSDSHLLEVNSISLDTVVRGSITEIYKYEGNKLIGVRHFKGNRILYSMSITDDGTIKSYYNELGTLINRYTVFNRDDSLGYQMRDTALKMIDGNIKGLELSVGVQRDHTVNFAEIISHNSNGTAIRYVDWGSQREVQLFRQIPSDSLDFFYDVGHRFPYLKKFYLEYPNIIYKNGRIKGIEFSTNKYLYKEYDGEACEVIYYDSRGDTIEVKKIEYDFLRN
jgi:hypothetical protein